MHSKIRSCTLAALVIACVLTACAAKRSQNALQEQSTWKVALPAGSQPEGIAAGSENDLWVACLSGNIIHVVGADEALQSLARIHTIACYTSKSAPSGMRYLPC